MSKTSANGKILIATPKITSRLFEKSVIYIHNDDETGSIGVILNRPMEKEMAANFSKDIGWQFPDRVHLGGPIERQLGYIIHSNDYAADSSIYLNDYISYTGGKSIVYDINRGIGPSRFILVTGYCAWQPKQLAGEILAGMWTVADFDLDFFFQNLDKDLGWEHAIHVAAQNKTRELLEPVDIH
jgi:putative transcriptional regulator